MARYSNARGIAVDRGGVGGPGPRRRVTVDAAVKARGSLAPGRL